MNKILLIDCSPEVAKAVADLLGDKVTLESSSFGDGFSPKDSSMIILESDKGMDPILQKVGDIRRGCNFSNVPIVIIKQQEDHIPMEHFFTAGATEVLSLDAPPVACRQILMGYLSLNRKPLEKEMEYLTPFIDNTVKVLKTMASVEPTFREVWFSKEFKIFGDISGIIGLSGNSEGTVAVTFYWPLARKIIAQMMKVEEDMVNAEYIHDGVGEIINMISGATKKNFSGTPYYFELSIPTVVVGSGHQLGHPEASSIAVLIFDVEETAFALQVCLKPKSKTA
jgi:chemotaxis protein CheX